MSGTQAVTSTPVQLPKHGDVGRARAQPQGQQTPGKSPVWVRVVLALICLLGRADDGPGDHVLPDAGRRQLDRLVDRLHHPGQRRPDVPELREVFDQADMGTAFVNSLAITVPATIIPILIAAFAAYAFTFMGSPVATCC